jgi:hypothetical protein
MGDIADMMLDGILCEQCGSYIDTRRHDGLDDGEPPQKPGRPRLN